MDWISYERNCYLLARNEKKYLADGSFNGRVEKLISAISPEDYQQAVKILEKMVSYAPEYYKAEEKYAPILIYKSEPVCYGILNHFADCMKNALEELGETVEIFDSTRQPLEGLIELSKQKFKAVLGIQSYFFSLRLKNGGLLHDHFHAPLFNMQLDHPCVMHTHLIDPPQNFTLLTHDVNYQQYLKKYYGNPIQSELFMPGGEPSPKIPSGADKIYDMTFVGSFYPWKGWSDSVKAADKKYAGLVRRLIGEMKNHPNDTYEACFERILTKLNLDYSIEQKRQILYECQTAYYCVMNFYREKIVRTILDAGIELHVYGDSWNTADWDRYGNLKRHAAVDGEGALIVYSGSRLSLNIMSWHKGGMTERIANMMLCKTTVVTDKSSYLRDHFTDGEDIVLFDLERIEQLPGKIKQLLSDGQKLEEISEAGYKKAREYHTWNARAEQFLGLVDKYSNR